MATYNPPLDLFQRQVESIRSQTHANWICVVSDDDSAPARFAEMQRILDGDPRFVVSRSPRRLGYYHNFERALSMTPPSAAYATLADQDDRWHPEKLETLLGALGDANLVYSDARIVDRDGRAALQHVLVAASQQLHQHGIASGCEHRHRRRFAFPSRAARAGAAVPAAPRLALPRPLAGPGRAGERADHLRGPPAL